MLKDIENIGDECEIGWMLTRHHPQCAAITRQEGGLDWGTEDFAEYVADDNSLGLVAVFEDVVVGFISYRFDEEVVVIHNIGVDSIFKRRGVGRKLANDVLAKATKANLGVCAAVPEDNLAAQLFFRRCGYKATHIAGAKTLNCAYVFEIKGNGKVADE